MKKKIILFTLVTKKEGKEIKVRRECRTSFHVLIYVTAVCSLKVKDVRLFIVLTKKEGKEVKV
jgi:hypothetical protein